MHELAARPEIASLQAEVRQNIRRLRVVKIQIHNLDDITVYSTEPHQIGENQAQNVGFQKANVGKTKSDLVYRDNPLATDPVAGIRNLLMSYIPARKTSGGPVDGVFEIYSSGRAILHSIA